MADNDTASQQILLGRKLLRKLTIASEEAIADEDSCSICHEAYFTGSHREMPMKAPCGHIFGGHCIQLWISSASEPRCCPMCRKLVLGGRTRGETAAWRDYEMLSRYTVRRPLLGPTLTEDAEQWALKAENLWQHFCEDVVHSLEEIKDAANWMYNRGHVVRYTIEIATVDRFAREYKESHSEPLRSFYTKRFPDTYDKLCAHLDSIDSHRGTFLTPGEDHFVWLARQHRKISECHERLLERAKPRDA